MGHRDSYARRDWAGYALSDTAPYRHGYNPLAVISGVMPPYSLTGCGGSCIYWALI